MTAATVTPVRATRWRHCTTSLLAVLSRPLVGSSCSTPAQHGGATWQYAYSDTTCIFEAVTLSWLGTLRIPTA
jgi:hypothetical protein